MRKTLTVIAMTAALTSATITPAVAHSGTAGPYQSLSTCKQARKKAVDQKHTVTPCRKAVNGFIFGYWH